MGHIKNELMQYKTKICCFERNCEAEWSMLEAIKKADMTDDERIFFEFKVTTNLIYHKGSKTSKCPFCKSFCQRQNENTLRVSCIVCSRKKSSNAEFCWHCKINWTKDHKCSQPNETDEKAMRAVLNCAPKKTIFHSRNTGVPSKRLCPKCKILLTHANACKKIECFRCKTIFCFVCLKIAIDGKLQCGSSFHNCQVAPIQNC